jgi:hypothetical protein
VERHPNAEHVRLLEPSREPARRVRRLDVEPADDGEAIGMPGGNLERPCIAVAGPGRRNNDGAIDAGCVHRREHLFRTEPVGPMRRTLLRPRPRMIRGFGRPEMDLNIGHRHIHPRRAGCAFFTSEFRILTDV